MSDDTVTTEESATVSNGSGLSMLHMRAGLFGKSAATLNDDSYLSTSLVSEKTSGETGTADSKLCNDDNVKRDEDNNEKSSNVETIDKSEESASAEDSDGKMDCQTNVDEKENSGEGELNEEDVHTAQPNTIEDSAEPNVGENDSDLQESVVNNNEINSPPEENIPSESDVTSKNVEEENDEKEEEEEEKEEEEREEEEENVKSEGVSKKLEEEQQSVSDDKVTGVDSTEKIEEAAEVNAESFVDEEELKDDNVSSEIEKETPIKTPGKRGRKPKSARPVDNTPKVEDVEVHEDRRGSLRNRNVNVEATPKKAVASTPSKKEIVETPKTPATPGKRGRPRKTPIEAEVTPVVKQSSGKRGRPRKEEAKVVETEEPNQSEVETEEEPAELETSTPKKRGRKPKKVEEKKEDDEEHKDPAPEKRSVGRPKRTSTITVPVEEASPKKRGRRISAANDGSDSTPKTKKEDQKIPATAPAGRRGAAKTASSKDPYDFNTEHETHPVPFKHIEMRLQSFGDVSYSRIGAGRYENTEKAAEARVSNLPDLIPASKTKKTLAELTPRRKSLKKDKTSLKDEPEDVEQDETPVPTPKKGTVGRKRKQPNDNEPTSAKKSQLEVVAPQLDAEHLWTVDHPEDEHVPYEAGARVYAVFNKVFYPAVIVQSGKDSLGRYKLQYVSDNVVKDVPNEGVIPLRAVIADSPCVGTVDGDLVELRVIKSPNAACAKEWMEATFVLSPIDDDGNCSSEEISLEWTSLNLESSDWRDYISKKSREVTQVLVENIAISDNRQSRRSRATEDITKTPTYMTPQAKGSSKRGRKKKEVSSGLEEDSIDNDFIDTVRCGSPLTLFAGKIFILTSAQRGNDGPGFKKKQMTEFIEQCQGMVVEDFTAVDVHPELEPFLISDTCYRTHKYLSAMARGVPCVSHEWIQKCRESNSLADYNEHLLPAGQSILDNDYYPLPKNQKNLLKDKIVFVHTNNRPAASKALSFIQIWEPIVTLLGGTPVTEPPESTLEIDIMLTDATASQEYLDMAAEQNAIIASSEWLIQGIIMDKLPEVDAHPRFRFDGGGKS